MSSGPRHLRPRAGEAPRAPLRYCYKCKKFRYLIWFPLVKETRERCLLCARRRNGYLAAFARVRRARGHWTQQQAAKFVGVSIKTFKRWESLRPPSAPYRQKIAELEAVTRAEAGKRSRG